MDRTTTEQADVVPSHSASEGTQPDSPVRPSLDSVATLTHEKAARIIERCGYEVTGYALTHKGGLRKAIVDGSAVRWFPDIDDFERMMAWKEPIGPGTPPETAVGDPLLDNDGSQGAAAVPVALTVQRPALAAAPSVPVVASVEEALGALAADLGCVRNDTVSHNAGWFVPGRPTAFASAIDAIKALFDSLKGGGTVYRAPPRPKAEPAGRSVQALADAAEHHEQAALF